MKIGIFHRKLLSQAYAIPVPLARQLPMIQPCRHINYKFFLRKLYDLLSEHHVVYVTNFQHLHNSHACQLTNTAFVKQWPSALMANDYKLLQLQSKADIKSHK